MKEIFVIFTVIIIIFSDVFISNADVVDAIVAVVNEEIILKSDLERAVEEYVSNEDFIYEMHRSDLTKKVLTFLIDEKLLEQEIIRSNIIATSDEIDLAVERIRERNDYDSLEEVLLCEGITMTRFRQELRKQILKNKLIEMCVYSRIIITDDKLKKYYDANSNIYAGVDKLHLCTVLVKFTSKNDYKSRSELVTNMFNILRQIDSGVVFDNVSSQFSFSENIHMGFLGSFSKEELLEDVKNVLEGVAIGGRSRIICTEFGLQVFYIEDVVKAGSKSLEAAREEIYQQLLSEEINLGFGKWFESVKDSYHIEIFDKNLEI